MNVCVRACVRASAYTHPTHKMHIIENVIRARKAMENEIVAGFSKNERRGRDTNYVLCRAKHFDLDTCCANSAKT